MIRKPSHVWVQIRTSPKINFYSLLICLHHTANPYHTMSKDTACAALTHPHTHTQKDLASGVLVPVSFFKERKLLHYLFVSFYTGHVAIEEMLMNVVFLLIANSNYYQQIQL